MNDILVTKLDDPLIEKAFQGRVKPSVMPSYTVVKKCSLMPRRFEYQGVNYALVALQSYAEAKEAVFATRDRLIMLCAGLLAVAAVGGFFAARTVTRPINYIVGSMNQLANGETDFELKGADRKDEIGDMAKAVLVFKENAEQRKGLEMQARAERDKERQRQLFLEELINDFKPTMSESLSTVSEQMGLMRDASITLDELATNAQGSSEAAGSSSNNASDNVSAVAAATEEMTATVQEIANQTEATTRIVTETVEAAETTNQNVQTLSEAAEPYWQCGQSDPGYCRANQPAGAQRHD